MEGYFAHSFGDDLSRWERLEVHLAEVAKLAAKFAYAFRAEEWGRLAGLWHDLGKYSAEFQAYLRSANGIDGHLETTGGKVDHSSAGAQHAFKRFGREGLPLAFAIAGHHAGLLDFLSELGACLEKRLKNEDLPRWSDAPPSLLNFGKPPNPKLNFDPSRLGFQLSLFCRMLFSCLVDADFLATERFLAPERTTQRSRSPLALSDLEARLSASMEEKAKSAAATKINTLRQNILAQCRSKASLPPGLFSLTVPTGGGKTLSSLAFALRHAAMHPAHGFERVIFAIPFTSIIEQTAAIYREVLGDGAGQAVLEHHSNLNPEDPKRETAWSRLAAENWDAPLIVTTNVQFFESQFAVSTSRCRKLHNIARSIIILDEAQTLPVNLLEPSLAVLRELVANYGCSIVLCTATQPAVTRRVGFDIGLESVREIIDEPQQLYASLKRTKVRQLGPLNEDVLLERLAKAEQALCIVNTRPHAARLFSGLKARIPRKTAELFHLSTNMCANHRSQVLTTVRQRLMDNLPCRVLSTQLIEAGVDIDFPVVYRSLASFDSIAQAAGRCNREGKLPQGDVFVFEPEDVSLPASIAESVSVAKELLPDYEDLLSLEAIERYFQHYYWNARSKWNNSPVMAALSSNRLEFQFRQAAEAYQLIPDQGKPVIVMWDERGQQLAEQVMSAHPPDWRIQRQLQRYIVNVSDRVYAKLLAHGDVAVFHEQYAVLTNRNCYDPQLGLVLDSSGVFDPETLIL